MIPRPQARLAVIAALCAIANVSPARAQDFDLPSPAWPPAAIGRWLERGLPPVRPTPLLETGIVRWHGLDALTTRTVAAGAGWRALRGGLGLAATGEPDLGWSTLAATVGAVVPRAGASLRVAARRDRAGAESGIEAGGIEAGGGAWMDARDGLHVWVTAPQMWLHGSAPPLSRPLEIGAAAELNGVTLWLANAGIPGGDAGGGPPGGPPGGKECGLSTGVGPLALWLLARDRPLRGGLGVAARAGLFRVACQVDSHPVLSETTRLSLSVGGGR